MSRPSTTAPNSSKKRRASKELKGNKEKKRRDSADDEGDVICNPVPNIGEKKSIFRRIIIELQKSQFRQ